MDKIIKGFNKQIEDIKKKGLVDLNDFCGYDVQDSDEDEIGNYDRAILRNEYEENMVLPYQKIELYSAPTFGYNDSKIK